MKSFSVNKAMFVYDISCLARNEGRKGQELLNPFHSPFSLDKLKTDCGALQDEINPNPNILTNRAIKRSENSV